MTKETTLYIAIFLLLVIAVFSVVTYNKNKKISDTEKANAKLTAENQRQQKIAENANISVSALAELISKQMNKQNEISIKY